MTGYTRQSLADIQNGQDIVAAPLNDEFNALATAFDGVIGHTHDGTAGSSPKIDLTLAVNGQLPIANMGASTYIKTLLDDTDAATARATLGSTIGTNVQAYDAGLQSISGLTTAANTMIYTTALDAYATTALTPYARTILDDADASTALSTLGVSTYIKTLLDDTDAATARATLGANDASNLNAGTLPAARLSGTYNITNSGNSATATLAANSTNFGGQPTSYYAKNDSGTYSINITGNAVTANTTTGNAATATLATKASTLANGGGNGAPMTFQWNDPGGAPAYIWGGSDGTNMRVYNPANITVGAATTASNANAFGGQPTSYYAKNDAGTYSIHITGNAGGNAATATTASNSNALGGVAAASWLQTANLGQAYADMFYGAIGTTMMVRKTAGVDLSQGDTSAGGNLVYSNAAGTSSSPSLSGTWMCMGRTSGLTGAAAVTVFKRII